MNKFMKTLYQRAVGYSADEVTEEYAREDGELKLIKKKISTKYFPPDLNALKLYTELTQNDVSFSKYSDEELEAEKKRLLAELKKNQTKGEDK